MAHKFKVGDEVKVLNGSTRDGGSCQFKQGTIETIVGDYATLKQGDDHHKACQISLGQLEPLSEPHHEAKASSPKFILQYGDELEPFNSEKEIRDRLSRMADEQDFSQLRGERLLVHDIKRTRTVSLGVKITIK